MTARKYQIAISLETIIVLQKIMGIHRKRPVVMKRWRKLGKYLKRAIDGKAIAV